MVDDTRLNIRERVRSVTCPKCNAEPGANCVGARGNERIQNHMERSDLFYGRAVVLSVEDIVDRYQYRITSGIIKVGDRFPTYNQLYDQLGISPDDAGMTALVSTAMKVLRAKGLVETRGNKGSFVIAKTVKATPKPTPEPTPIPEPHHKLDATSYNLGRYHQQKVIAQLYRAHPNTPHSPGTTYIVELPNGNFKIGYSENLPARWSQLADEFNGPIRIMATLAGGETREAILHVTFVCYRIKDAFKEQFEPCDELRRFCRATGHCKEGLEALQEVELVA